MTLELNLQRGLVGHWTMDDRDTSGGTLYDRSSTDSHGNISGPTTGQSGQIGEAYSWGGIGNDENITTTGSSLTDEHSISLWINFDALDIDGDNNYREVLDSQSGDQIRIIIEDQGAVSYRPFENNNFVSGSISLNTWEFITCVYNGSDRIIYINGLEVGRDTINTTGSASDFLIGSSTTAHNPSGRIDDIRIYNRVLSESEISALYNMRSQRTANL